MKSASWIDGLGKRLAHLAAAAGIYVFCAGAVGLVVYGCGYITEPVLSSLTMNPAAVTVNQPATLVWNWAKTYKSCVTGNDWTGATNGTNTFMKGTALSIAGSAAVNPGAVGLYTYSFSCINTAGIPQTSQITLNVYTRPTLALSLNPVTVGQSTTLTWSSTNTQSCTSGGAWSGQPVNPLASGSFLITQSVPGSYTYTLSCVETNQVSADTIISTAVPVTLAVNSTAIPNPPTVNLLLIPTGIPPGGTSPATLSWTSTNATSCAASGNDASWTGNQSINGSTTVGPSAPGTYTYTLTCTGSGASASESAVLTVFALPTVSIAVNPTSLAAGSSTGATLTWLSTNATACTGSGAWSGTEALSGSQSIPASTAGAFTYTLTCTGPGGSATNSATLTVAAASLTSVTVNPASATIAAQATQQFTATGNFSDGSTQDLTASAAWISSNTSLATITSPGGLATGVAAGGPVTITASASSGGQPFSGSAQLSITGGSTGLTCNAAPTPKGGGADPWDNQSFCVTFSGETDQLYNFTGTLTFTTPLTPGPVTLCQFASVGTVNNGPGSTPPAACSGSTSAGSTTLVLQDQFTNQFTVSFAPSGSTVNITGTFNFGAFGPGAGIAAGSLSGVEQ